MNTVHAIFEDGVFRPIDPVDLPEHTVVQFEPRIATGPLENRNNSNAIPVGLAKIYDVLGERYESGHADTAARHDEHQP